MILSWTFPRFIGFYIKDAAPSGYAACLFILPPKKVLGTLPIKAVFSDAGSIRGSKIQFLTFSLHYITILIVLCWWYKCFVLNGIIFVWQEIRRKTTTTMTDFDVNYSKLVSCYFLGSLYGLLCLTCGVAVTLICFREPMSLRKRQKVFYCLLFSLTGGMSMRSCFYG